MSILYCVVTGERIEAGDAISQTPRGHWYGVKARIRLTVEERARIVESLDAQPETESKAPTVRGVKAKIVADVEGLGDE